MTDRTAVVQVPPTPTTASHGRSEPDAGPVTTADLLIDKLVDWGVEVVFGLPGDGVTALLDAFRRNADRIRFVLVRHEEAAAFMASGWAKYTGRLGCCIGTTGPGAVHLLNGLYDAKVDQAPVLALTGSTYQDLQGLSYTQGVDTVKLYEDVARFNERISSAQHLLAVFDRAARSAVTGPGVAHLSFPIDVQQMPLDAMPASRVRFGQQPSARLDRVRAAPDPSAVEAAAEVLNAGHRTMVLVGQGAKDAGDLVEQVAERLAAPVAKALLGRTVIADDSPYTTGGIGHLGTTASEQAAHGCDTLLIVGSTMPWMEFYPHPGQAKVVQVDRVADRIGLRTAVDVPVVGDASATLTALLPLLKQRQDTSFLDAARAELHRWDGALRGMEQSPVVPLRPQVVAAAVSRHLESDAVVALDCGANTIFAARHLRLGVDQALALGGNLSTMGPGLPFAVAAQLAYPDRQCVAVVGDGGFTMLMGELSTAVKYELPIRVVVLRNDHYSRIETEDRDAGFPPFATEFHGIDLVAFAEACGATGYRCSTFEDVETTMADAFACPGPVLIEAQVSDQELPSAPDAYIRQG